jgi:Lon protease-like protein
LRKIGPPARRDLVRLLLARKGMDGFAGERWEILPALTLLRGVLFPGARCCVSLETVEAFGAVREATRSWGPKTLAVLASRREAGAPRAAVDVFDVGTVAEVLTLEQRSCCHHWVAELRAVARLRVCAHLRQEPFRVARVERLIEPAEDPALLRGLMAALRENVRRLATRQPEATSARRIARLLAGTDDGAEAVAHVMDLLRGLPLDEQQRALELPQLSDRLERTIELTHAHLCRTAPRRLPLLQ